MVPRTQAGRARTRAWTSVRAGCAIARTDDVATAQPSPLSPALEKQLDSCAITVLLPCSVTLTVTCFRLLDPQLPGELRAVVTV